MKRVVLFTTGLCLAFANGAACAQDKYPAKPVKIVVPYAPGGATDIVARILSEQLRQSLGQSFVVENKPGANGIVAINELVNSRPDGYTLMIGNVTTNAITPVLTPGKVPNYDKKVAPEAFARLAVHYTQREICEIVWLVATEHVYNMTNIGLNIHSDMLCDIAHGKTQSADVRVALPHSS